MEFQQVIERRLQSSNLLVTSEIRARFSANDVIETARRRRVDCVFIRAEKMSFIERMFCGNLVSGVAARAECSVEVVRGPIRYGAKISECADGAHHKDSLPIAG